MIDRGGPVIAGRSATETASNATGAAALSDKPNPYQSPQPADARETWWAALTRLLHVAPATRTPVFAGGDAVICDGIAFFIDPEDESVAYAASPSVEHGERRMNLVVSETVRVLPLFLKDHPEVHEQLRGRQLVVRLVDDYAGASSTFRRQIPLEWRILDPLLSDPPERAYAGEAER